MNPSTLSLQKSPLPNIELVDTKMEDLEKSTEKGIYKRLSRKIQYARD